MQQLRGLLLDAAGGLERRFDQAALKRGLRVAVRDALGRDDELRHLEPAAAAHVIGHQLDADALP